MRTVNPGQLATPGKNVPTICFELCYYTFRAKDTDWQCPGEGRELDTTHTSPLGRPPDRAWSRAALELTRTRPPRAALNQISFRTACSEPIFTRAHSGWAGLRVYTDVLNGCLLVS